jgi:hypothetical protein
MVTQMFFLTMQNILNLLLKEMGITVPIIPVSNPSSTKAFKILPQIFRIDLP